MGLTFKKQPRNTGLYVVGNPNEITSYMEYQQKALADDDPYGTCAAHHRGEISACGYFLKKLNELISEKI